MNFQEFTKISWYSRYSDTTEGVEMVPVASMTVAKHVGGAITVDIMVGGMETSTDAPALDGVICSLNEGTITSGESNPVVSVDVITDHIIFAVAVNVSPLGLRAGVAAPSMHASDISMISSIMEMTWMSSLELDPVVAFVVITSHVSSAITVDVSMLGVGSNMTAPASVVLWQGGGILNVHALHWTFDVLADLLSCNKTQKESDCFHIFV